MESPVTEDERRMLKDLHTALLTVPEGERTHLLGELKALADALLKVPRGSQKSIRPLLEDVRIVVGAYHRGSWAVRALIWVILTLGALGAAVQQLMLWRGGG